MTKNKISMLCLGVIGWFFAANSLMAQQGAMPTLPDTSLMAFNQISQSLTMFVFPANGQSQQQQKADEFECYRWAIQKSGVDPANLPVIEVAMPSGPTGAGVAGAARGAAAGAAIGAISRNGNAGRGAAIGATVGGLSGRSAGRQAQAQAGQRAQAQANQKEKELMDNFMKAFSACMQGKGYTIQ